jgi:hypothetical protein
MGKGKKSKELKEIWQQQQREHQTRRKKKPQRSSSSTLPPSSSSFTANVEACPSKVTGSVQARSAREGEKDGTPAIRVVPPV